MSTNVKLDSSASDDERRAALYRGELFVYGKRESVQQLAQFARGMIEQAFRGLDPEKAQYQLPVAQFAEILGRLKPEFIHHPKSKRLVRAVLEDFGCDPELTYFDVPRLRSSTSDDYLTSGIAYAWHPHRDTWYSAPPCQVNWWLPVYEVEAHNGMAFHPAYWNSSVPNNSSDYNYYVWNKVHRGPEVARILKQDPRPLPRAAEPLQLEPELRLVCPVGGLLLFSGAQMHSSVRNTSGKTRYSIDFRTIHLADAECRKGAPRSDEACSGTTMRDYLRAADLSKVPQEVVSLYDDGTVAEGEAVFVPR